MVYCVFIMPQSVVKCRKDGQTIALCPGHDDGNRSLSVKQADGKLLLKCFAGCSIEQILAALNLTKGDLFLNDRKSKASKPQNRQIEAVYLRREFPRLLKLPSMWTNSYFVSTAGNVSNETIRKYIEAQSRK